MPEIIAKTVGLDTVLKVGGILAAIALAWGVSQGRVEALENKVVQSVAQYQELDARTRALEIGMAQILEKLAPINRMDDRLLRIERGLKGNE